MNSNKASTSNILKFFKPKKPSRISARSAAGKRAVFFVLLAILVLGFSVKNSFAVTTYTDNQKSILETTYKLSTDQIKNLQDKNVSYNDFEKKVTDLQSPGSLYTAASAATSVYNESVSSGDVVSDSVNQFRGKAALQGLADGLSEIVLAVVIGVLAVIAAFCKQFVSMGAETLDFALNPSLYNFTSNTMIVQGWTIVRDVCNLFFLLILLFIAICTILKIEKYHAKKTLLMLIIMALLINFSKPIAIFIFDGSQLLMNFFLSQMGQTGTGQTTSTVVAKAAGIADLVYKALPGYLGSDQTSLNIAVQYLFAVVFLFMLAVAYFVTALMLIIRIVVIMLLIIVSPFAFFAAIIPDFSKMSSQWWSSLFEYSYYGPAAAFFLLLSAKLDGALPHLTTSTNASGMASLSTTVNNIIHYLTVLVFLYASIFMAKKFGGGAGAAVVGNANKFMKWAGGMSKGGGMWGAGARGVAWGSRTSGISGGVGQMIGASWFGKYLTKKGREDAQKDREAGVAEALGVKGAKEGREKQKVADLEERWKKEGKTKEDFKKSIHSKDAVERKAAARQLMKQGEAGHVINSEIARQGLTGNAITQFYDKELGNLSSNDLGKHDLEALSASPEGRQWVESRLKDYDTDPRLISNMLSGGHMKNFSFIRNLRNSGALNNPGTGQDSQARRQQGQNDREKIEVVSERLPRSRTTYDADGKPVT